MSKYIINCRTLVEALKKGGLLSSSEYQKALTDLGSEANGSLLNSLPHQKGKALYMVPAVAPLLANCGLLDTIAQHFELFIEPREIDNARDEIARTEFNEELRQWLRSLINRVSRGIEKGVYIVPFINTSCSDYQKILKEFENNPDFLTFADILFFSPEGKEIIWVDDRFCNSYMSRDTIPIIGINEILQALRHRGVLSEPTYYEKLIMLRTGNFRYIPLTATEILHYLRRAEIAECEVVETKELKTIRRYVSACLLDYRRLQVPPKKPIGGNQHGEIAFYVKTQRAITYALVDLWRNDNSDDKTKARANWILENLHTGTTGCFSLIRPDLADDEKRNILGMDLADLLTSGISIPEKKVKGNKKTLSPRKEYFNWINNTVLKKRFDNDPDLIDVVAESIKRLLLNNLDVQKVPTEEERMKIFVLQRFYEDLTDAVRKRIWADTAFMDRVGLRTGFAIEVGGYYFSKDDFWQAAPEAVNSRSAALCTFDGGENFELVCSEISPDGTTLLSLKRKNGTEISKMGDKVFRLLHSSVEEREKILRNNRIWFDCDEKTFKKAILDIISIENPSDRIERLEVYRKSSSAFYYDGLRKKLSLKGELIWDDLLPTSGNGLISHFRFDTPLQKECDFSKVLEKIAEQLFKEEGLAATIDRLSGFPVPFPPSFLEEVAKISRKDLKAVLNEINKKWASPVSKIHLVSLGLKFGNGDDEIIDLVKKAIGELFNDEKGKAIFNAFSAILGWVNEEFGCWLEAKDWPPWIRLALTWFHASQLINILCEAEAPLNWIEEFFGRKARRHLDAAIFHRDPQIWYDATYPRNVRREILLLKGFGYAVDGVDIELLENLEIFRYTHSFAYQEIEGQDFPSLMLLHDPSLEGNVLGSYLGQDSQILRPLIDEKILGELSSEQLFALAQRELGTLENDLSDIKAWTLLFSVIGDFPIYQSLHDGFKRLVERLDLVKIYKKDSRTWRLTLLLVSAYISRHQASLRNRTEEELIRLATFIHNKSAKKGVEIKTNKENFLERDDWFLVDGALSLSIVSNDSRSSCQNFCKLIKRLIDVWPQLSELIQPIVFLLVAALPLENSSDLWDLMLTLRAKRE